MSLAKNPRSYMGVAANQPPELIKAQVAPDTADVSYVLGTIWIDEPNLDVYQLAGFSAGAAQWTILGVDPAAATDVPHGGTGLVTITDHGVMVGSGVAAVTPLSVGSTGEVLIGSTGADPAFGALGVNSGLTIHGVLLGETNSAIVATTAGSNGQLLVGSTAADPVFATVSSSDSSVEFTTGAGTLSLQVASATESQAGAGEISTDAEAEANSVSTNKFLVPSNLAALKAASNSTFTQSPILQSNLTTGAAPTGATGDVNLMAFQDGEIMEQFILGAGQTIIAPRMSAAGLLVSLDLADNEGAEYNWGARAGAKNTFTIGTSPAFYLEWAFTLADVTGADPVMIGFRKVEANNATFASYTDFASIGVSETDNSASISLKTNLNSGGVTTTDTTDAWTDGQKHTLRVNVTTAGVVTYLIDGVAPSATAAYTFTNALAVMPFIHWVQAAGTTSALHIHSLKCGFQDWN